MLSESTKDENPLLEKYIKTIEAFTQNDLDELEQILDKVKSTKLKTLIQRDVQLARSKLVTKLLNEEVERQNEKQGIFVKRKTIITEREIEVIEEDIEGYIAKYVKGYKEKVRSIKQLLPDKKTKEITDALIRCKGKEEDAMEGLLTGELPKRPEIPKIKVKKIIKESKEILEQEVNNNLKEGTKIIPFFEDVTLPKYENNIEMLTDRVNRLKEMIDLEKNETKRLSQQVDKYRNRTNNSTSGLSDMLDDGKVGNSGNEMEEDEENMKRNRMYLPGEYEVIEREESRTFTFKPERTFSNEVSHIHFRVAESEFHRLLTTKSAFRVKEVKYIVTSWLIKQFEQSRHNIAFEVNRKYSEVKPILCFCDIKDYSDDGIDWVVKNNVKADKGNCFKFTNDSKIAGPIIAQNHGKIMLFLVLPGKTSVQNDVNQHKLEKLPSGSHSFRTSDGLSVTVFNNAMVLPYYIVYYDQVTNNNVNYNYNNPQNPYGIVRLDEEWKNIEQNAQADKFMNDVKEFYQKALVKQSKERVLDPTSFNQQKEEEVSPITPGSALSGEHFLLDDDEEPNSALTTGSDKFIMEEDH